MTELPWQLASELKTANHKLPFSEIIYCNIGNPQQLNQPPITYFRQVRASCGGAPLSPNARRSQVLCLAENPSLLSDANALKAFAPDVVERAKSIVADVGSSTGAYTNSKGAMPQRGVARLVRECGGVAQVSNSCGTTWRASLRRATAFRRITSTSSSATARVRR